MPITYYHTGLDQYSTDTLEKIRRDLEKNPASRRRNGWEGSRLTAVKAELIRRRKEWEA